MAAGIEYATVGEQPVTGPLIEELPLPNPSSAISRLHPLRRHRAPRREVHRFLTRADLTLIALSNVPAAQRPKTSRGLSAAWTLYWRVQWSLATARADRARRRALPPRY
ncbi:hypothetical protein [Actinomadura latina]|uniref:Uncharacterized protein n=1 Tax=Actinomadura latina TaxID=163603 RepID=A0A846Z797_9ACTN|nr:hypothetical protein [Actinomadura latina]NKZ08211.1 hypothetical protein [Actinomadura latina]